jgi:hypothetical protein
MHRIIAPAAFAALLSLSAASADDKTPPTKTAPTQPPQPQTLQTQPQAFDPAKAWTQMQQQMLRQFDANGDGRLSGQEQILAQEAMRRHGINLGIAPSGFPGADQFSKQFDRDGDGKLNPAESMAAQAAYQRILNHGKSGPRTGGGVQTGGLPSPGPAINPAASAAAKDDKVPPLVKRFDKDGDGKLNDAEKAPAQAELKKSKVKDGKDKTKKDAKDKADAPEKGAADKGK